MMVGPSGSGKSSAWRVLLKALERFEGTEGVAHVIDPKAISKEALYGVLDPNTREWTDGLFTHILRYLQNILPNSQSIFKYLKNRIVSSKKKLDDIVIFQSHC